MIPAELSQACPDVRLATEADAVSGVLPDYVAAPASTEEAGALLRAAAGLNLAVVPRGGGTRLDWGVPPSRCDLVVDTRRLDQVLEHAAGDLVARVQAGVRLDRLAEVLSKAGQRLAVDPPAGCQPAGPLSTGLSTAPVSDEPAARPPDGLPGESAGGFPDEAGTVGGLVATGVAGPLRLRYGGPRDLLIGITLVRADGTIARAGGKVVKNVAGYDIGKLLAGSYGTLGLITEATFRLHPSPAAAAYIGVSCPPDATATAAAALLTAASSPLAPVAAELDWPGHDAPITVAVALEGDPDGVAERTALMRDLLTSATTPSPASPAGHIHTSGPVSNTGSGSGPGLAADAGGSSSASVTDEPPAWWGHGPAAASTGTVLRIAFWAGQLSAVLDAIRAAAAHAGLDPAVGGSAAAGVLHAALPPDIQPAVAAQFVTALRAALYGHQAQPAGPPAATPAAATAAATAGPAARASVVVLHAPPAVREAVDMWGPAPAVALMRAVKDQFDPEHRMSPGRFVGGI